MARLARMDNNGLLSFGVYVLLGVYQLSLNNVESVHIPVIPNEALSSPSSITAMKNSAVWLHWNFTFDSLRGTFVFKSQHWIVNETTFDSVTVIADQKLNSAISVSSSWASRVTAFSNNGTLMIKNLGYNDSVRQFHSTAFYGVTGSGGTLSTGLRPVVSLNIIGSPSLIFSVPKTLELLEGDSSSIVTHLDGNPKPTAEAQWSGSSTKTSLAVVEQYPFIYKAEYSINKIAPSFCGKVLTLKAQNNVGKAAEINIAITVLLSLDNPNLRAGKPNQSCVEVQWQKKESGLCNVTYAVGFKDQSGSVQYTNTEINKSGTTRCGIPSNVNITQVELQMSSTKKSATVIVDVSEKPIPPPTSAPTTKETSTRTVSKPTKSTSNTNAKTNAPMTTVKTSAPQPPTTPGTQVGAIVGGAVGGLVALVLLVLLVVYCMKRGKRDRDRDNDSGEPGYPLANKKENVYASADEPHTKAPEPTYADPNKPTLIYGKLGEGGGRKGPRPPRNEPSEYADVMLDENGYPAVGAVTSYTDGYGDKPRSREGSGRRAGPENRRPPPPYTEPKLDEDGYPTGGRVPPVYAQVDKSRRKR